MYRVKVYSRDNLGWHWCNTAEVLKSACEGITWDLNRGLDFRKAKRMIQKELMEELKLSWKDWLNSWEITIDKGKRIIRVIDKEIYNGLSWGYIEAEIFYDERNERVKEFSQKAREFIQNSETFYIETDLARDHALYFLIEELKEKYNLEEINEVNKEFVEELISELETRISNYEFRDNVHTKACHNFEVESEDWGYSITDDKLEIWFTSINQPWSAEKETIMITYQPVSQEG